LEDALAAEIQRSEVAVTVGPDGLVVSPREIGFLDSGSAEIRDTSVSAFGRIAWLLAERPTACEIEGHTDNQPIHNARFSDNWDLSAARATELLRLLIVKYGFAPPRLSAAGYAEYHPVNSNDRGTRPKPAGRNRDTRQTVCEQDCAASGGGERELKLAGRRAPPTHPQAARNPRLPSRSPA
jgi:flagellar motor protein MotB